VSNISWARIRWALPPPPPVGQNRSSVFRAIVEMCMTLGSHDSAFGGLTSCTLLSADACGQVAYRTGVYSFTTARLPSTCIPHNLPCLVFESSNAFLTYT